MRLNQRLRVVQGLEDSARRTIVRSLAVEIPFAANELEELYTLFKVNHGLMFQTFVIMDIIFTTTK